ncbi:MAG: methylmalonyl Co-A mutase-associated GTPase MeaB, partial [Roseicyclus sp.]
LAPAGGDELQGVKRGIMEMADLILVNKADGDLKATATRTVADYGGALRLLRKRPQDPAGFPRALPVSAATGEGLDEAWAEIERLADWRRETGWWARTRADQAARWFEEEVRAGLLQRLATPAARALMRKTAAAVAAGEVSADAAAAEVLSRLGT